MKYKSNHRKSISNFSPANENGLKKIKKAEILFRVFGYFSAEMQIYIDTYFFPSYLFIGQYYKLENSSVWVDFMVENGNVRTMNFFFHQTICYVSYLFASAKSIIQTESFHLHLLVVLFLHADSDLCRRNTARLIKFTFFMRMKWKRKETRKSGFAITSEMLP